LISVLIESGLVPKIGLLDTFLVITKAKQFSISRIASFAEADHEPDPAKNRDGSQEQSDGEGFAQQQYGAERRDGRHTELYRCGRG
jgi:hypothetical protein